LIESAWKSNEGHLSTYDTVIPANTSAVLYLPVKKEQVADFVDIDGVSFIGMTENNGIEVAQFEVKSGGYHFVVNENKLSVSLVDGYITGINLYSLFDSYVDSRKVSGPLVNILNNRLRQAEKHYNDQKVKQASKSIEDFVKYLNNKENSKHISNDAKESLEKEAQKLMNTWK
jgi:hypothetical protein